jgi:hypothetical protein
MTIGYIEAKDVGARLEEIAESPQLKRYRAALENLVLTDYLDFRWYVHGDLHASGKLATMNSDFHLQMPADATEKAVELLRAFTAREPEPLRQPQELAERLARLTHLIADVVNTALDSGVASELLRDLHSAFAEVLIPDLTSKQFADMFAQTLAYGLFAARVNHKSDRPFKRADAAREIPRTNPFLRRLFAAITGPDLDEEPFAGLVDDLAQLLAWADMPKILARFGTRTRQQDPVVHFYETFLAAYDPTLREVRGVYYTPAPVVSYIVRSVEQVLTRQFGMADGFADSQVIKYSGAGDGVREASGPRLLILDPAVGTGTFLYAIITRIREAFRKRGDAGRWPGYVRDTLLRQVFGFELLMAPYAVAHLNLGMQLAAQDLPAEDRKDWAYDFIADERLGIYLTNSLEEALGRSDLLLGAFISEEANAAARIKRDLPIVVVLGNPPYSGISANRGKWIDDLLHGRPEGEPSYYTVGGKSLHERKLWLQDDYVKFIRLAQWRIDRSGSGVLAFITNHGYLDNPTFRGMREKLIAGFSDIYILDLHGNTKKGERTPDGHVDKNVFDIQQGVAIGIFVKRPQHVGAAKVHHAEIWGERPAKYDWLESHDVETTKWTTLTPESPDYLLVPQDTAHKDEYLNGWRITEAMPEAVTGIATARDDFVIDFDEAKLLGRVSDLRGTRLSDDEVRDKYFVGKGSRLYPRGDSRGWKLPAVRKRVRADPRWKDRVVLCRYRPFDDRSLYYTSWMVDWPRSDVMRHMLAGRNMALLTSRMTKGEEFQHVHITRNITEVICLSPKTSNNAFLFPLYLYPADQQSLLDRPAGQPTANFAPEFIDAIEGAAKLRFVAEGTGDLDQSIGPEGVLGYIFAVLNAPSYRTRYGEFLKRDFPRIPIVTDPATFRDIARLGGELIGLHLFEAGTSGKSVAHYPIAGSNAVERGYPRYLPAGTTDPQNGANLGEGRIYLNSGGGRNTGVGQYFEGVEPEVWNFHVGGYQVCEKWLRDRRGRTLTDQELDRYQHILTALHYSLNVVREIDGLMSAGYFNRLSVSPPHDNGS